MHATKPNWAILVLFSAAIGSLLTLTGLGHLSWVRADNREPNAIQQELTLKRLVIKDQEGRDRIALGTDNDQPFVLLLDESQSPRMQMSVLKDGTTGIHIYDDKRNGRIELASLPDGTSQLTLSVADSRRSVVAASEHGVSGFGFYDSRDRTLLGLVAESDSSRKLILSDSSARVRAELGLFEDKGSALILTNSDGQKKALREPR